MIKKTKHGTSGCPAEDCSGGNAGRQSDLTDGQIKLLSEKMQTKALKSQGRRCTYCGCVYLRNYSAHDIHTILGFLDSGILGKGWHECKA